MKHKTSDLSVFENKFVIIIIIISSEFYQISLAVKLSLNHSSRPLHDALHIFPSTSHSHL